MYIAAFFRRECLQRMELWELSEGFATFKTREGAASGWPGRRGPNIAHLKSHIARKRTLLHKLRKKYRPKPKIWAFFAFLLTNFIAQRTKISPNILFWAMKLPVWPPWAAFVSLTSNGVKDQNASKTRLFFHIPGCPHAPPLQPL